jgi:hypothetical protein
MIKFLASFALFCPGQIVTLEKPAEHNPTGHENMINMSPKTSMTRLDFARDTYGPLNFFYPFLSTHSSV